jgi:predicted RNase H-like HicB family nuclease
MKANSIQFNTEIWKEGKMYVAYAPQLDISSCGKTAAEAKKNIQEAVALFFEETRRRVTILKINLQKKIAAGFKKQSTADVKDAMSDFCDYLAIVDNK